MMVEYSNWIGSAGVGLLLLAFLLNAFNQISTESRSYLLLNVLGAGIACYASYLIAFWPFVVLEAVWFLVGLAAWLRLPVRRPA